AVLVTHPYVRPDADEPVGQHGVTMNLLRRCKLHVCSPLFAPSHAPPATPGFGLRLRLGGSPPASAGGRSRAGSRPRPATPPPGAPWPAHRAWVGCWPAAAALR